MKGRVLRVVALLFAAGVATFVVLRALRVARLAIPALIGAIVVVGWLLIAPQYIATDTLIPPIPNVTSDGAVVRNGVAVVVACGKKRNFMAVEAAPEPRTGTWGVERRGECNVYFHHQPGAHQRYMRHLRAHEERQE